MEYGRYMLLIYLAAGTIRTCNYIMNSCYRSRWRGSVWNCAGDQLSVPDQCACHLDCRNPPPSALPGCICLCVYGRADPVDLELYYTISGKWIKPVTEEGKQKLKEFHRELKKN